MTYCQQLQPFPNVDSTIGRYLGKAIVFKEKNYQVQNVMALDKFLIIPPPKNEV